VLLPSPAGRVPISAVAMESAARSSLVVVDSQRQIPLWEQGLIRIFGDSFPRVVCGLAAMHQRQTSLFPWEPPEVTIASYSELAKAVEDLSLFDLVVFDDVATLSWRGRAAILAHPAPSHALGIHVGGSPPELDEAVTTFVGRVIYPPPNALHADQDYVVRVDLEPMERRLYETASREGGDADLSRQVVLNAHGKVVAIAELAEVVSEGTLLIYCPHEPLARRLAHSIGLGLVTPHTPAFEKARSLADASGGSIAGVVLTRLEDIAGTSAATLAVIVSAPLRAARRARNLFKSSAVPGSIFQVVVRDTFEEADIDDPEAPEQQELFT
jgi:hypothetical protein